MKKRSTKAVVDVGLQDVVNMLPVDVGPADALVTLVTSTELAPVHAAAEATGLCVSAVSVSGTGFVVTCGPHVPPFTGATVAEVVAAIAAYNCKHCGSGGSHTPNCGRPR